LDFAKLSTDELIELLAACGGDAPRRLAAAIVSRGAKALPWLCQLVSEERWWREEEGMLALHAMHLLGGIGDPSAASALLEPLRRSEDSDFITEDMPGVLARLGPKAIPKLREFVEDRAQDPVMRSVVYTGLVGMAELHPELAEQVKQIGRDVATRCLLKGEPIAAVLGVDLAEYQDPADRKILEKLHERGLWEEGAIPWQEVLDAFREGRPEDQLEHATLDPMSWFGSGRDKV
jgi:hypothetical protein